MIKSYAILKSAGLLAVLLFSISVAAGTQASAVAKSLLAITPPAAYENVHVVPLSTDKHASEFLIFVKQGVKAHIHERHSETIYVISGEAEMRVGNSKRAIQAGTFVKVPEGMVHGVKVTSTEPLVVLSVQAPEFKGKDRVFVE